MFHLRHVVEEPGLLQPEREAVLRHPREAGRASEPARAQPRARHRSTVSNQYPHISKYYRTD